MSAAFTDGFFECRRRWGLEPWTLEKLGCPSGINSDELSCILSSVNTCPEGAGTLDTLVVASLCCGRRETWRSEWQFLVDNGLKQSLRESLAQSLHNETCLWKAVAPKLLSVPAILHTQLAASASNDELSLTDAGIAHASARLSDCVGRLVSWSTAFASPLLHTCPPNWPETNHEGVIGKLLALYGLHPETSLTSDEMWQCGHCGKITTSDVSCEASHTQQCPWKQALLDVAFGPSQSRKNCASLEVRWSSNRKLTFWDPPLGLWRLSRCDISTTRNFEEFACWNIRVSDIVKNILDVASEAQKTELNSVRFELGVVAKDKLLPTCPNTPKKRSCVTRYDEMRSGKRSRDGDVVGVTQSVWNPRRETTQTLSEDIVCYAMKVQCGLHFELDRQKQLDALLAAVRKEVIDSQVIKPPTTKTPEAAMGAPPQTSSTVRVTVGNFNSTPALIPQSVGMKPVAQGSFPSVPILSMQPHQRPFAPVPQPPVFNFAPSGTQPVISVTPSQGILPLPPPIVTTATSANSTAPLLQKPQEPARQAAVLSEPQGAARKNAAPISRATAQTAQTAPDINSIQSSLGRGRGRGGGVRGRGGRGR